ncbi:MAG: hypothetical protein HQ536_04500 [Parcubacteria group bacterium]|nr:hypothetical protein [Parcubacteria group bacterium]
MKRFALVTLLVVGCSAQPQTVNYIPQHLQVGEGVFFEISDSGGRDGIQFVKLKVMNDSILTQHVVVGCEFTQEDRLISKNEVVLRMRPYTWRRAAVYSSRRTAWGSRVVCDLTDETHPLDYTVVTKVRN